jgi:hypothetical protein
MTRALLIVTLTMALIACESLPPEDDVPAVIDNPTRESHGELVAIVASTLGQPLVMISHDALTRTDLLIIEQKRIQHPKNEQDAKQQHETSARFRLVVNHSRCVLIYLQDNSRIRLNETSCSKQE